MKKVHKEREMTEHPVVGHDAWVEARRKHLTKEKEFTRLRDQLSRERRELPWELVEKDYTFEGERGARTLSELFDGRSQLVIYHAMFNPETAGRRRRGRSTLRAPSAPSGWITSTTSPSTSTTATSRWPPSRMRPIQRSPRTGSAWLGFPWYASAGSDFNFDYRVSFTEDELAAGKVDYNYGANPWNSMSEAPGSASSSRMATAASSIPTRLTRAGWTC